MKVIDEKNNSIYDFPRLLILILGKRKSKQKQHEPKQTNPEQKIYLLLN